MLMVSSSTMTLSCTNFYHPMNINNVNRVFIHIFLNIQSKLKNRENGLVNTWISKGNFYSDFKIPFQYFYMYTQSIRKVYILEIQKEIQSTRIIIVCYFLHKIDILNNWMTTEFILRRSQMPVLKTPTQVRTSISNRSTCDN